MKKAPSLRKLKESVSEPKEMRDHKYDNRPTIRLTEDQLPEMKDWKVGQKYMIECEVEMMSMGKDQYGPNKDGMCCELKVTKIGVEEGDED